ncbi:CocE/NonD family hydrolase [Gillisia limnaea]|uniref:Hydrolase CocE/NonD family protein n=1 Tax=Gillisia limnaea (strain DSM 15749 / LMG 21470 / R-8282) TaxID=865937 RepID=H2BXE0_GILLR|nr:CocE/NonD family hydrolase [Gillisia limnaea]EHQ02022.1 hydrolase CocE/NonD family protein [Gillisia limnaea DSM 15749]
MKHIFTILCFLLTFAVFSFAQENTSSDTIYHIQDSILIPTKSGIDISATIVQKQTNTKALPVVLFYTTYYQGEGDNFFAKLSADRDYVGIVAYARGIRTNVNHYAPYENEQADIYDIIDWISKQEWCNGKVGMYGGSYTGFSQWSTVKNIHPALKTIVPQVAVMPGYDTPMENNVQMNLGLYWPNDNVYKKEPIRSSLPFEWFNSGIAWKNLDSLEGFKNEIFQNWLLHPSYDNYWQSLVPTPEEYAKINIPVLTTTGYYDGSQIGSLQYFKLHNKYNKNANHYFVIGPYDHWGGQRKPAKKLMGYEIDSVANINVMDLAYQWLDYILKGKPKPEILKDKVNYQVMGANEWRHSPSLQAINNDTLIFYLDNKALVTQKPKKKRFEKQLVDFKDRETQNNYFTPEIIFDTLDASNGLVFTSKPFNRSFLINGSFTGNLFATINKKDLDVSLALYELMPDGKYFFLTRYVGRASYAKDSSKRQLLQSNKKESIPFDNTRFVSKKINEGSRLVILLNINKHPFEIINYGSGKQVSDETIKDAGEPLEIKWHNESFIIIPIWRN